MLTWKHAHVFMSCKLSGPGGSTPTMHMGSLQIAYSSLFFFRCFPVILQELPAFLYLTSRPARAPSLALPHRSFCKSSQSRSTSPVILQEFPVSLYLTSHSARAPSHALATSPVILQELPCPTSPVINFARAPSLALPHLSFYKSSM